MKPAEISLVEAKRERHAGFEYRCSVHGDLGWVRTLPGDITPDHRAMRAAVHHLREKHAVA